MTDIQASGNNITKSLKELIGETNYYIKSGYFTYSQNDLNIIKSFYNRIYREILKKKSQPQSKQDLTVLYDSYCKVKAELESAIIINTPNVDYEYLNISDFQDNINVSVIYSLFDKCLKSLYSYNDDKEYAIGDFYKRDVLIGPLRNREQLQVCLDKNFYHIPMVNLPVRPEEIKNVALYQSRNFFGKNAGIRYYARVKSFEIVERTNITEIP